MSSAFSALASLNYYRSSQPRAGQETNEESRDLFGLHRSAWNQANPATGCEAGKHPSTLVALAAPRLALTTNQEGRGG